MVTIYLPYAHNRHHALLDFDFLVQGAGFFHQSQFYTHHYDLSADDTNGHCVNN